MEKRTETQPDKSSGVQRMGKYKKKKKKKNPTSPIILPKAT